MIKNKSMHQIILRICDEIIENKDFLNDLDRAIGDGDHGSNMARGFSECKNKIISLADMDLASILKTMAMTLISTVGGASGPLYGTAFLKASGVLSGKEVIDENDIIKVYEAVIEGIKHRGHAELGHKTMLDAIIPAYEAFKNSIENGKDVIESCTQAQSAAKVGMEGTKEFKAIKGRASFLGDRSIGHQDPGATSSYIIIKTIAQEIG